MPHQLLDETSAKAFRAAKLRYSIIVGTIIGLTITCISILIYQEVQKNRLAKLAKEYTEINSLYYQENLQAPETALEYSSSDVDHTKSMILFTQFALKHPKEPYGWQAAIRAANYDINHGNLQAAKELFEIIIPNTYKFPLIQIKMGTVLAGIYADENDATNALQQLENIGKIKNNPNPDQTKFYHAQILHAFGKSEEARQILNTLNSEEAKIWFNYIPAPEPKAQAANLPS